MIYGRPEDKLIPEVPEHVEHHDSMSKPLRRQSNQDQKQTRRDSNKRLMANLSSENIDEKTVLLLPGGEQLSVDGVMGKIADVGQGFGTGRHSKVREHKSPQKKTIEDSSIIQTPTKPLVTPTTAVVV